MADDDPAYECLVADPVLTIRQFLFISPAARFAPPWVPSLKPTGASCASVRIFRRSLTFTYHECPTSGLTDVFEIALGRVALAVEFRVDFGGHFRHVEIATEELVDLLRGVLRISQDVGSLQNQ